MGSEENVEGGRLKEGLAEEVRLNLKHKEFSRWRCGKVWAQQEVLEA